MTISRTGFPSDGYLWEVDRQSEHSFRAYGNNHSPAISDEAKAFEALIFGALQADAKEVQRVDLLDENFSQEIRDRERVEFFRRLNLTEYNNLSAIENKEA